MLAISATWMGNRPLNEGKQTSYHDRVYTFIQLIYNKNDHLAKWSTCQMFDIFFGMYTPLDPRRPLHMFRQILFSFQYLEQCIFAVASCPIWKESSNNKPQSSWYKHLEKSPKVPYRLNFETVKYRWAAKGHLASLFLYNVLLQNMTDLLLKCAFILAADNCNFWDTAFDIVLTLYFSLTCDYFDLFQIAN